MKAKKERKEGRKNNRKVSLFHPMQLLRKIIEKSDSLLGKYSDNVIECSTL